MSTNSEPSIHRILLNLVKLEANLSTSTSNSVDNHSSSITKTTFYQQLIQGFQELTNYLQTKATIKDLQDIYTHILKLSLRQFVSYQIEQDQWTLETMKIMIAIIECLVQLFTRINFYLLPSINNALTTATTTLETFNIHDPKNNPLENISPSISSSSTSSSSILSSQPTIQNKHLFIHEYLENQSYYSELLMYFIFMFEYIKSKLLPTLSTTSTSSISSSEQEETKRNQKPIKSLLLANEEHLLQQLLLVCNQFIQMGHQITCINQPQYSIQWIKLWIIIDNHHQLQTKQTILLQYIHMMILFSSSMIAKDLTLSALQTLCISLQAFSTCSLFWRQSFPGIFSALIKIAHSPIHRTEHILFYTMISIIYLCQNISNEQNITNKQLFNTCFSLSHNNTNNNNNKNLSESQKNIQNIRSMLQSLSLSSTSSTTSSPNPSIPSTTSQTTTNTNTLSPCLYEFSSIDIFLSWRINILQRIQKPFVTSYRLIISKLHISHKQQILTQLTSLLTHGYQFLGHICILDFCLCYLELFQDDLLSIRQYAKQSITQLIDTYQTLHASELFWQFKTHFVMILSTLLPSSSSTTTSISSFTTTTTTTDASSHSIEEIDSSTSSSFMTDLALVQNLKLAIGLGQILSNSSTHLFMLHEHEILLSLEQLFLPDLTHFTTSILSTLDSFTYVLPPFTSSTSSMTNELTCTVSYYRLVWKHSRDSRVLSLARAFIMQQSRYWPMNLFEEKLSLKIIKLIKNIVCFYLSDSQTFKLSITRFRKRVTSIISYLWILKYRLFAELTMISKPPKIVCAYCQLPSSTSSTLLRCSRCRQTYYCCQEHQQKHWKQIHKQHCTPCTTNTTNNNKEPPKPSLDPLAIDPHHILTQYFSDNVFVLPDSIRETKKFQCHQYNLLKYCHMIHRLLRLYLLAISRSELVSSSTAAASSSKTGSSSFFPSSSSSSFLALDDNTLQSKDFGETNGGERYISSLLALIASQALEALADVLFLAPSHDFIIKCLFHNQATDMEYYADLDENIVTQIKLSSLHTQSTKSSNTSSISLFFTLIQCIVDRTFPLVSTAALSTFTRLSFYLMANSSNTPQTTPTQETTTSPTMTSIHQTKEETNRYLIMFFIQYIDYFIDEAILLLRTQVFMISNSSYLQNISNPLIHISLSDPSLFLPMIESLIEQTHHSTISYLPKEFLEFLFSSRSSSIHLIYSMIKYVFMTCSLQFQELTSTSSSVIPNPMSSAMFLLRDLVQETLLHMDHQFSHTQQTSSNPSILISLSQVRIIVEILGLLTNSIPLSYVSTLQLPSHTIKQVFNHKQWNNLTQLLTQTSISPYNPEIYQEIALYVQQKPNIYAMIQINPDMIQSIHSSSELLFNSLINFDFSLQKLNHFPDLSDDDDSNEPNEEEEEPDDEQENDQEETIDLAKESPTIQLLLDIAERTFYTLSFINRFQRSPSDQSISLSSQDITTLLTIVRSSISILTQVLLRFLSFETILLPFVHKIWKYVLLPRLIDFIEVLNIYTLEKSASLMPTNQSLSIPTHLPSNKSMNNSISINSSHETNTLLSIEQNISTPKSFCLSLETSELFPTTKHMSTNKNNNQNNIPSIASILSSTRNALTRFIEEDHRRRLLYLLPLFFDLLRFMITLTPEFLSQRYQETIFPIFISIARDYQRLYIQQHAISLVFSPSTTPATTASTSTESNILQSDQWTKTKLAFLSISKIVFQQSIRSITCQQHQSWIMMIVWFYLTNLSTYETIEIRNQSLQMMIQCAQTNPSFVRHMFSLLIMSNPVVSSIVMTAEEEQTFMLVLSSYETFSMEDIEDNWLMIAEEIVRLLHELTPLSTVFAASQPHLSLFKDKKPLNSNANDNNNPSSSNQPHVRQHKNVLAKHLLKAYRQDIGIIKACQLILIHLHNNTLSSLSSFTIKTSKEKQPTSFLFDEKNQEKINKNHNNNSMNEIHLDDNYQRLLNLWSEI